MSQADEADTPATADDAGTADALEAGGAETLVAAPAEPADEPRSAAASEDANIKKLERLMALWLIYGRYPPEPAASAPGA